MDMDISTMDGSCHCGTVRFRVRLTNGLHNARRFTCSYCRMRGAIAVSAEFAGVDMRSSLLRGTAWYPTRAVLYSTVTDAATSRSSMREATGQAAAGPLHTGT